MSAVVVTALYTRRERVLWRDTGDHVIARVLGSAPGCVLIGGGAAQVWRLLDRPAPVAEIAAVLDTAEESVGEDAVAAVLVELEARGLVHRLESDRG